MKKPRYINSPEWMRSVRNDLDSAHEEWAAPTLKGDLSKLDAIAAYLDTILTDLGYPPGPHKCPECGLEHSRP